MFDIRVFTKEKCYSLSADTYKEGLEKISTLDFTTISLTASFYDHRSGILTRKYIGTCDDEKFPKTISWEIQRKESSNHG